MLLGFMIHEAAHFFVGEILGYDMFVSINKAGLADGGAYTTEFQAQFVAMAGPITTYFEAIVGLLLIYAFKAKWVFPFVFFALMMRIMATVVSLSNPNDEARVSEWLGIGMWALPLIAIAGLFIITLLASRHLNLDWKRWVFSWLVISAGITAIIFTEQYYALA